VFLRPATDLPLGFTGNALPCRDDADLGFTEAHRVSRRPQFLGYGGMRRRSRSSVQVRERAVRMVLEHGPEHSPTPLHSVFGSAHRGRSEVLRRKPWDSYENALAETVNGLYKAEGIDHRCAWRGIEQVELATLEWVKWFDNRRILRSIGASLLPSWRYSTI